MMQLSDPLYEELELIVNSIIPEGELRKPKIYCNYPECPCQGTKHGCYFVFESYTHCIEWERYCNSVF